MTEEHKKQVIGTLGEMNLAIVLHEKGWSVFKPIVDEYVDFVITKNYCTRCKAFSSLYERRTVKKKPGKKPVTTKAVTNLCSKCKKDTLIKIVRFIQVKTSDGVWSGKNPIGKFSFHAKLRHHVDPRSFYAWVAVHPDGETVQKKLCYYIFHHKDVEEFDNIKLASYQITDNQKTTLRIDRECDVKNQGTIHSYAVFDRFLEDFGSLEEIIPSIDLPSKRTTK